MSQPIRHHDMHVQETARMLEKAGSYRYRVDELFRDGVEAAFCAVFKPWEATPEARDKREERYMQIVRRYTRDTSEQENPQGYQIVRDVFPGLMSRLVMDIRDNGPRDFLGAVAGALGTLSPHLGQFFTPDSVSQLCAGLSVSIEEVKRECAKKGYTSIMEPACGAGGILLAVAKMMREADLSTGRQALMYGIDISPQSFHMCSLQLALNNVSAVIYLGDGLSADINAESRDKVKTPAYYTDFIPALHTFRNPPMRSRSAA